jgi:hypothetical protein
MKNFKSFSLILLIVNILKITSQKTNKYMKFKEVIDEINNSNKHLNFKEILLNIISLISDYYVFYDIEKSSYGKQFDILNELGKVNIVNTNYYNFVTDVKKIIRKPTDAHLDFYSSIISQYIYNSPIKYYVSTENNIPTLKYYSINTILNEYSNKNEIMKCEGKIIKSISGQDPFDYIQNFGKYYILRSSHGEFSINLRLTFKGSLSVYPFEETTLTNIKLDFDDCDSFTFDYLIYKNQSININILNLNNIDKKYKLPISYLPIFEFEKMYNYENNMNSLKNNKVEVSWDLNYYNEFKYKYDKDEKVNVIYISTFLNKYGNNVVNDYLKVRDNLAKNEDPIIIILDRNPGGYLALSLFLQKIINFKLAMTKVRFSSRKTNNSKNLYDKMFTQVYDIQKCSREYNPDTKIETDKYDNNIIHNRSLVYTILNSYTYYFYKPSKIIDRSPTEIIVFTDGISVSAASFLINDLKESGNAIIAGYNGNPKNKDELFLASNSPSFVLHSSNFKDDRCRNLTNKNLTITITNFETFNDSYINKTNETLIPREYQKVNIDYRSSILGEYNDSKYLTFIKEGKKIIEHFKDNCSPNNINLIKINNTCKFDNKYTHGGYRCGKDLKWDYSKCFPSYCDIGYIFDNKNKKCVKDQCYVIVAKKMFKKFFILFILIILIVGFSLSFYIYKKFKYFEQKTDFNIGLI